MMENHAIRTQTSLTARLGVDGADRGAGNGQGGGRPDGSGPGKGDLYGDQYVLLRDLDPAGGGGNGEPVLDANGQPILIGSNGLPVYFVQGADGDYEIPLEMLPYVQTVELERANVARAPDKVMAKSLSDALGKIDAATVVSADPAGRLVCDGVTIDSPLENLALYQYLMTAGGDHAWPEVVSHWPDALQALLGEGRQAPAWDPSSLLGAAFAKEATITLDAVIYENNVLGVNVPTTTAEGTRVAYFDFSDSRGETYSYDRAERFGDVWLQWYADTDGDPVTLEQVQQPLLEAVFGNQAWSDQYLQQSADPAVFTSSPAELSGLNDFAQAADDARAVINFMHTYGAVELAGSPPAAPVRVTAAGGVTQTPENGELILGTVHRDVIETDGGAQTVLAGNGCDTVSTGGGTDRLEGGNAGDLLDGGAAGDVLNGGRGKDVLIGGAAPDVLTGGLGADRFVYLERSDAPARVEGAGLAAPDAASAGPRIETITDFQVPIDRIDLSALDGALHVADQPEAHAVWAVEVEGGTEIRIDLDGHLSGAQPAEMELLLLGVHASEIDARAFVL